MAKGNRGKVLAVYIGDPLSYSDRIRNWCDMFRYDRCYPVSEFAPSSGELKGWCLFFQPFQNGFPVGFTVGRWNSYGATTVIQFDRSSGGGEWISSEDMKQLESLNATIEMRKTKREQEGPSVVNVI
jgi:hypothetical protein